MTKSFLSQKDIINEDFMALKKDKFERLLIFDRAPFEQKLKHGHNFSKKLFLRTLHTVMTLLVHSDDNVRGIIGIVNQANRPHPIPIMQREQEDGKAGGDLEKYIHNTTFRMKHAIVAVEEDPIIKKITTS